MYKDTTIVIPTLNEAGNIGSLLRDLYAQYSGSSIIVVDDGSTDGTQTMVKSANATLLDRTGKRKGLTASVVDGVLRAQTPFVVVMDADGQHPVTAVKELIDALRAGNAVAVGTRTAFPSDWTLVRRIISSCANSLGRIRLFLSGAYTPDVVSGFFAVRTSVFQTQIHAHRDSFIPEGYKVCLDLLKTLPRKTKVAAVSYSFLLRETGGSKMGAKQVFAYLKSLLT